jgi:hypothetical protein
MALLQQDTNQNSSDRAAPLDVDVSLTIQSEAAAGTGRMASFTKRFFVSGYRSTVDRLPSK